MRYENIPELMKLEQYIREADFPQARDLFPISDSPSMLTTINACKAQILWLEYLIDINKYEEAHNLIEILSNFPLIVDSPMVSLDLLLEKLHWMVSVEINAQDMSDMSEMSEMSDVSEIVGISSVISQKLEKTNKLTDYQINFRSGLFFLRKSLFYIQMGEIQKAQTLALKSVSIFEKISSNCYLSNCYENLTTIEINRGDLVKVLFYAKKAVKFAKKTKCVRGMALGCSILANIYHELGQNEKALDNAKNAMIHLQKFENDLYKSEILGIMSALNWETGNVAKAIEHAEQAIIYGFASNSIYGICTALFYTITYYLEVNEPEKATKKFMVLEELHQTHQGDLIGSFLTLSQALIYKKQPDFGSKTKAKNIFKDLITREEIPLELISLALLNLCEILLMEIRISKNHNEKHIKELNEYLDLLFNQIRPQLSIPCKARLYILQSKFELVQLQFKKARHALVQAKKIAEKYKLNYLTPKISVEYDNLLEQEMIEDLSQVEKLKFSERVQIIGLDDQISRLAQKQRFSPVIIEEEVPIVLSIVLTSGVTFFFHSFSPDWTFDSQLFGGFLTAFNTFSREIFEEKLDRAVFGKFKVLMEPLEEMVVCYVIKGQSHLAQQKLSDFVNRIIQNTSLWEQLKKTAEMNEVIVLTSKKIPLLTDLVHEIFKFKSLNHRVE